MRSTHKGLRTLAAAIAVLITFGATTGAGAAPGATHDRPFKLEFTGALEIVVGAHWCDSLPWVGVVIVTDEGPATHLGRVVAEATQCTNSETGEVANGVVTMIAANGDELHATYSGGTGSSAPVEVTQIFNGGTGRFANATGQAIEWAYPNDPEAGRVWGTMEGVISYDASDRKHK